MWLRLDDSFCEHPKIRGLSDRAFRIHLQALCYCARFLTDGFVDRAVAERWFKRSSTKLQAELSEIWKKTQAPDEPGFRIHDFLDYNLSKAQELKRKMAHAARQQRYRVTHHVTGQLTHHVTPHVTVSRPVPSSREEKERRIPLKATPPEPLLLEPTGSKNGLKPADLVSMWKVHVPKGRMPKKLTAARERRARIVIREHSGIELVEAMQAVNNSAFCTGANDRGWIADLDFFLKPGNVDRLIEGSFEGKKPSDGWDDVMAKVAERQRQRARGEEVS